MPKLASRGPVLLAQSGREALTNYDFIVEAPFRACRLCGAVYQSRLDRLAYYATDENDRAYYNLRGLERRERWEELHNRRAHPHYSTELRHLIISGLPVTPEASTKLASYGIIPLGPTPYQDEIADALFEAPRAPINDVEG